MSQNLISHHWSELTAVFNDRTQLFMKSTEYQSVSVDIIINIIIIFRMYILWHLFEEFHPTGWYIQ